MASERQIAANRLNAQRSTGPKSVRGKRRASKNALRHGLSVRRDLTDENEARELATKVGKQLNTDASSLLEWALAHLEVERVRDAQAQLLKMSNYFSRSDLLREVLAMERYERRALTKRRRSHNAIGK